MDTQCKLNPRALGLAVLAPVLARTLLVAAMCGLALPTFAASGPLPGDQIRKLIVGNTVIGPGYRTLYDFSYAADGQIYGGTGYSTDQGNWQIRDDNVYCHEWSTFFGGEERCYQWYDTGNGRYLLKNVDVFRQYDVDVWRIEPGMGF